MCISLESAEGDLGAGLMPGKTVQVWMGSGDLFGA